MVKADWSAEAKYFACIRLYDPSGKLMNIGRYEVHVHNPTIDRSVCVIFANRVTGEFGMGAGEITSAEIATEAVRVLAKMDKNKKNEGKVLVPEVKL